MDIQYGTQIPSQYVRCFVRLTDPVKLLWQLWQNLLSEHVSKLHLFHCMLLMYRQEWRFEEFESKYDLHRHLLWSGRKLHEGLHRLLLNLSDMVLSFGNDNRPVLKSTISWCL